MVAIDTNVVVRILTNDDPPQVARARSLLQRETAWIGLAVLMETEWVLRAVYRLDRTTIHQALDRLVQLPQVVVEDDPACSRTLDLYNAGLDFADALHLAVTNGRASRFATFDTDLVRHAPRCGVTLSIVTP